jgi:glycosyltransferase involved in cell wall biosynthesis
LATTINELLDDPTRQQKLAAAGLVRAAKFTWPAMASQLVKLYHQLLTQS